MGTNPSARSCVSEVLTLFDHISFVTHLIASPLASEITLAASFVVVFSDVILIVVFSSLLFAFLCVVNGLYFCHACKMAPTLLF